MKSRIAKKKGMKFLIDRSTSESQALSEVVLRTIDLRRVSKQLDKRLITARDNGMNNNPGAR